MTERQALEFARSGRATYTTDRLLTKLGNEKFWDLELVGEKAIPGYVAHGGFYVDRAGVFRSYLTEKGEERLAALTARAAS
jgi:hypothetical protein